jgi:hypothetical protein
MNATLGSWAFLWLRWRRFWIPAVRLRRDIEESPHHAFHPLRDLSVFRVLVAF